MGTETYPVLPLRAGLVDKSRVEDVVHVACLAFEVVWNLQPRVEESVSEARCVRKQHPQSDLVLLVYTIDAVCVYLLLADLWSVLFDGLGIVETNFALFDKLE